jgi:hypothetical protein
LRWTPGSGSLSGGYEATHGSTRQDRSDCRISAPAVRLAARAHGFVEDVKGELQRIERSALSR